MRIYIYIYIICITHNQFWIITNLTTNLNASNVINIVDTLGLFYPDEISLLNFLWHEF